MNWYSLSDQALSELDDIWSYIARDNPEAADRWIAKLLDACETIAHNPRMGHAREELTEKPVLFWPVDSYLIIYQINRDQIDVLAVTQGSRDIPSYLRRRT